MRKNIIFILGGLMSIFLALEGGVHTFDLSVIDSALQNKKESTTLTASKIVKERRAQNLPVYNWGLGENPFPVPKHLAAAVKEHASEASYTPVEGIPGLAEALAKVYSVDSYQIDPKHIIISPGLKEVLFDLQMAFGGEIIHVIPHWVSYPEQTALLHKKTIVIETSEEDAYKLTPQKLEKALKQDPKTPKLMIFNHPVNPTGQAYSDSELKALAEVAKRYPLLIVADEVYLGNHFRGERHTIAKYLPQRTIRTSSLSKEFAAGGYRLGWAIFPNRLSLLKNAVASIASSTYSCAPVPQQYAALAAMNSFEAYQPELQKRAYIFRYLGRHLYQRFKDLGLKTYVPEAAWYLLLDFTPFEKELHARGITTNQELVETLIADTGITFVAGASFGFPSEKLIVRGSFVDFSGQEALLACKGLDLTKEPPQSFYGSWMDRMNKSIDILTLWLGR